MIRALIASGSLGVPGEIRIIETHISWVLLAGEFAFKVKKPVNRGFVDFSTLAARHEACCEELRLNRRLTPQAYIGLVCLRGSVTAPVLDGPGPIIDYAVKMVRFPEGATLSGEVAGDLASAEIADLARFLAGFHAELPKASTDFGWGTPELAWAPVGASLEQLDELLTGQQARILLAEAHRFLETEFRRRRDLMVERQRAGFVRECHGDLHLGNLVRLEGRLLPFDALEFDPALRWIDVLNEVAFLVMDLEVNGRNHAGFRFLNEYLDASGDYAGLPLLPFYIAYRALVRAKVTALGPDHRLTSSMDHVRVLLDRAARPLAGAVPLLVLMSGISGSGKSFLARELANLLPAIHLRSDVERKRLFGLTAAARTDAGLGEGIYGGSASARTYSRLRDLASTTLDAGMAVIVDATNLRRAHRADLRTAAAITRCATAIVACHCDPGVLTARVSQRQALSTDPSEAGIEVVEHQRREFEPPAADEADLVLHIDTSAGPDWRSVSERLLTVAVRKIH
jgi:aminoglycoside phosphotransferase family enzyme/predicted kinase